MNIAKITLILSMGSFFEFFDFMLYTHLSPVLFKEFFPINSNEVNTMMYYWSFCLSYLLTPLGAFIMGYLGDTYGRKASIIFSTIAMSLSCVLITILPGYSKIGITASIVLMLCRVIQCMTSTGEIVGSWVYLTESISTPAKYTAVGILNSLAILGHLFAIIVGIISLKYTNNWRWAFAIGISISIISMLSRIYLKESQSFINYKKSINNIKNAQEKIQLFSSNTQNKANIKILIYLFFVNCVTPLRFCFIYFYCSKILKAKFLFSDLQIMQNNLFVISCHVIGNTIFALLGYKICVMKLVKFKSAVFTIITLLAFFSSGYLSILNPTDYKTIMLIQALIMLFPIDAGPAEPKLLLSLPISIRYRYFALMFALARMFVYCLTTFGLLIEKSIGLFNVFLLIFLPLIIMFQISMRKINKIIEQ